METDENEIVLFNSAGSQLAPSENGNPQGTKVTSPFPSVFGCLDQSMQA